VAYDRAKILHRDISVGNVLISADGKRGLLIDWELCKRVSPVPQESDPSTHPPRDSDVMKKLSQMQAVKRRPDRIVSHFTIFPTFIPTRNLGHMAVHLCTLALTARPRARAAG
jgi:serine/threonine protein kinase